MAVLPSHSALVAGPWALVHRAMHEHELIEHEGGLALAVTLVRAVGWLSRRDLRTRGVGAGPDIGTPGAQCLGAHRFEFALVAQAPGTPPEQVMAHAEALRRPPRVLRGHPVEAPRSVEIGNPAVATSSVRRLADGRLELRLWNPSPRAQAVALEHTAWQPVFADGRPLADGNGPLTLRPHGILTLRERSSA